jgi:hypothetical protein
LCAQGLVGRYGTVRGRIGPSLRDGIATIARVAGRPVVNLFAGVLSRWTKPDAALCAFSPVGVGCDWNVALAGRSFDFSVKKVDPLGHDTHGTSLDVAAGKPLDVCW